MALTTYTTYDTIRALLGVASTEIEDVVIALPNYELEFQFEMGDVDAGGGAVLTEYTRIAAIVAGSRTTDETQFFNLVNMMAAYSVARQLLGSVDMFAPIKITDGSAEQLRMKDPYARLREAIYASYASILARVTELLGVLVPTAAVVVANPRTYISNVGIGTDPVTGA